MTTSSKYEWHRIPSGLSECPVCGLKKTALDSKGQRYTAGEHCAVKEGEIIGAQWVRREKSPTGWKMRLLGLIQKPKNPQIQPKTVKLLRRAAALHVQGLKLVAIEKELGLNAGHLRSLISYHEFLWEKIVGESVMSALAKKVRQEMGTDAVLLNPDIHIAQAKIAERWLKSKGEKLFPDSGEMTLTRFYFEHYEPQFLFEATRDCKNIYKIVLRKWKYLTGDPPIDKITSEMLCKFRDAMKNFPGHGGMPTAVATVRGQLKCIQTLLDKLGPPGPRNRDAFGLLKIVPFAKLPRPDYKIPRTLTDEQITAFYEAAAAMDKPWSEGIKPPAWWKALLVLAWNTGLRTGTILSIRMEEIDWENHRLILPSRRMKSKRPQIVHLNKTAMEHLQAIRGGERELLFPWPSPHGGKSEGHTNDSFYRAIKKLFRIAGIPENELYRLGIHNIRKTLATRLWEQSPAAAQYALGHTAMDITRQHYVDGGPLVARALDALTQPAAFAKG